LSSSNKLTNAGTRNICTQYLSTQMFSCLIGIFVTRWRDTGWNAAYEKVYHLILYTSSPDRCCHRYELFQCNTNICDCYAKAMFTTICCLLVPTAYSFTFTENTSPSEVLWKCGKRTWTRPWTNVGNVCEEYISHRATDHILDMLRPFVLLIRHGYYVLKKIKSIMGLVMFKGNKWNRRVCLISKVGHRNLYKERNFLWRKSELSCNSTQLVIQDFILI